MLKIGDTMKKIIKSGLPIIVTFILNYIIIILSAIIYYLLGNKEVDIFLYQIYPYILIIYYLGVILYLYSKNKQKENKPNKYFPQIYLGISLAIFLNMIIFKIKPPTNIEINYIPLNLITSGIIGPIYEEILFRYIFYNRLKKYNTQKKAILITNIVFALMHNSPIKIIYAFIMGLVFNYIYEKDKTIISPILVHVATNIISLFLHEYNIYILILSIINLLLSIEVYLVKK